MLSSLRLACIVPVLLASGIAQGPLFTPLNGQIWDGNGGPLLAGRVYHVVSNSSACGIQVPGGRTLTIQAGAIVKVGGCVGITGQVIAQGTAQAPIVFTSIHDDTHGGDSNQNGAATVPQPGDWSAWDFLGGGSAFDHCLFRYGGTTGGTMLFLRSNQVAVRHCTMELGAGSAMVEASTAIVQDCEFRDFPGVPVRGLSLVSLQQFTNNRALRCTAGDYALVQYGGTFPAGGLAIDRSHSMNGIGVFVFDFVGVQRPRVPAGQQWTIGLGCILKFARGGIQSSGRIVAQGIAPPLQVVFTSLQDDVFGGDTNKDGNATQPARGDWDGIALGAGDTSQLDWTVIRWGGLVGGEGLRIDGSSAVLQTCYLQGSAGHGVNFGAPAFPPPSLRDTTILDCAGYGVLGIRWESLAGSHDVFCGGNGFDHLRVQGGTVAQPTVVHRDAFPGEVLEVVGATTVDAGGALELPAGTVLKFSSASGFLARLGGVLRLRGTARRPIVITSIHDDAVGGDTNRNGSATAPAPGQWHNLRFDDNGISRLENVVLRYANTGAAAVDANVAAHVLLRVRVEHSGIGFRLAATCTADDLVAWNCTGDGIQLAGGAAVLRHATVAGNGGAGIRRTAPWSGTVCNSIAWNNAAGNFAALSAAEVSSSDGGFAGSNGCINVDPQFVGAAAGNLQPGPASPCLGAAGLAVALAVGRDTAEFPRALDHGLLGAALPDMGAYERPVWHLSVSGEPRLNQAPMTFTVDGPPGFALLLIGLDDGPPVWLPPYGSLLTGLTTALLAAVPTGQPVSLQLAGGASLLGLRFAMQGLGLLGNAGAMSDVDRNEVRR
jgi:hypothetical protein